MKLTDTTVAAGDDDGLSLKVNDERHSCDGSRGESFGRWKRLSNDALMARQMIEGGRGKR